MKKKFCLKIRRECSGLNLQTYKLDYRFYIEYRYFRFIGRWKSIYHFSPSDLGGENDGNYYPLWFRTPENALDFVDKIKTYQDLKNYQYEQIDKK